MRLGLLSVDLIAAARLVLRRVVNVVLRSSEL